MPRAPRRISPGRHPRPDELCKRAQPGLKISASVVDSLPKGAYLARVRRTILPAAILAGAVIAAAGVSAQAPPDVDTLLARISERLAQYYKRAQSVVCTEKSTVQPLTSNFGQSGLA